MTKPLESKNEDERKNIINLLSKLQVALIDQNAENLIEQTADQIQELIAKARIEAIEEFCTDIQRKVRLEFEGGGRYPGHLIEPWTDVVRPIIYSHAKSNK
jgi:mannose/cellobiose epimerase-like protein (N-acyl-D-glucosamine 2-epimerase family)